MQNTNERVKGITAIISTEVHEWYQLTVPKGKNLITGEVHENDPV